LAENAPESRNLHLNFQLFSGLKPPDRTLLREVATPPPRTPSMAVLAVHGDGTQTVMLHVGHTVF